MAIEWKYRGRIFNLADIESIRRLIAANPEASRWALSRKLCEEWDWKQANGALRDMVCRGLLLMLERTGESYRPISLRACQQTTLPSRLDRSLRRCEKIGWQAKAPAPRACKSFGSKVGQTLSSVRPAARPVFSQLLRERSRRDGTVVC